MAQLAAFNTMTAIKKKLHGMKQKREEAFDRADQLEQKLIEHRAISEKVSQAALTAVSLMLQTSSYRSSRLGLSHWDPPYAMHRRVCLELYCCSMVEWSWWDSSLI